MRFIDYQLNLESFHDVFFFTILNLNKKNGNKILFIVKFVFNSNQLQKVTKNIIFRHYFFMCVMYSVRFNIRLCKKNLLLV